ncbi:hypothetical protein Syun_020383 [Stephania yunnanensis]|uniref:DUF4283 domain-containing protein n=1 Tax=Stephania yunnanensis TaxID=152371 RepID=A0AAP0IDT6_9MAGN
MVMDDSPWTFNQQALLLKRMEVIDQLASLELVELEMWVRVHKLPVGFMNENIAKVIGNHIGSFVEVDPWNDTKNLTRNKKRKQKKEGSDNKREERGKREKKGEKDRREREREREGRVTKKERKKR